MLGLRTVAQARRAGAAAAGWRARRPLRPLFDVRGQAWQMASPVSDTTSDIALLQRIAAGDSAAATLFVERHQGPVFRFCRAICRDESAAEDVLQETFIAALRAAASFEGAANGSARAWLLTTARRCSIRLGRRRAGEPAAHEELAELGVRAGWGDERDPEREFSAREQATLLRTALETLDSDLREVLVLRELEGLSGEETAELLGITLAAMKSRLHRARLSLAAAVREVQDGTR